MARHPARNRIAAGAFLLLMAAAAVAVLVLVGGWRSWFEAQQAIRIHFESAPNVKIGSPVLLAGHPVGRVYDINLVEVPCPPDRRHGGKCYVVEVTVELPKRYRIHQNAVVTIQQALVGQSSVINIADVGHTKPVTEPLKGYQTSPFAAAASELGIGETEKKNLSAILDNLSATTRRIREDLPEIIEKLKTTGKNLSEVSEKAKGTLDRVDGILDENRENLKETVANARDLTANAKKKTDELLASLKEASEKVNGILEENRPDVRKTVTHARSFAEKADTAGGEILENVRTASKTLNATLDDFKAVAADAKSIMHTNRARIATTMQNFHETSDHLKALAKEVRRAPWRLFAKPDKEEVESINLYDTARAFSAAASDLDSAADTLQVMLEAKDKGVEVPEDVFQEMLKHLEKTAQEFGRAEEALIKEYDRIQK